ncbi:hypothetical protein [Martelella sp. FOR1707]
MTDLHNLTRQGLEDEALGLRDENAELRVEIAERRGEIERLENMRKELSSTPQGAVIAKLQRRVDAARSSRNEAMREVKLVEALLNTVLKEQKSRSA